ncbi:MAG: hypothetical protein PHW26_04010 [Eubacteriales bacterium]|nr:hypothetical protein [Eubacteriales bacterium]
MRKFIKWTALVTGILFLLFVVGSIVFRVQIAEIAYKRDPTEANLVKLAVEIVKHLDYKRMTKYLPLAAELDNFAELSEQNGWFIKAFSDKKDAVNYTYMAVVIRAALSFIYADEYDEFHKVFLKTVDKLLYCDDRNIMSIAWVAALDEKTISETGFENIIHALDAYPSPYNPEEGLESPEAFRAGAALEGLKVFVYWQMGDFSSGDRIEAEWDQILNDYITNTQEKNSP